MKISEIINVSIGLSVTPPSQAGFTVPMLLVDHDDVPIDRRYIEVTKSDYATALTAATEQHGWCTALWGQNYNAAKAYIGRWVSADSSPYFVCQSYETTIATWTGVADGCMTVTSTSGSDALAALDFSAVTSIVDVAAVIDAALVSGGVSAVRCAVDALDRVIFSDPAVTGAGADAVVIKASGAGTHIELPAYLNVAAGFAQGGVDLEPLETALSLILAKDNTPYLICQRGGSITQMLALSTAISAMPKYLLLVSDDANGKSSTDTTDIGYKVHALSHNKTQIAYTEHTTDNGAAANQYPDAAAIGEILVRANKEGAVSLAFNPMSGLSESGLDVDNTTVIPLTVGDRTALEGKGYDYLIAPSTVTHLRSGLAAGGQEVRVMIGKEFMSAKISEDFYGYLIANEVVTFSDPDLLALKSIVSYWAEEMAKRGLLDESSFEWHWPSASEFTAAEKATHTMTLSDVFSAEVFGSVNDVVMTLSFSV